MQLHRQTDAADRLDIGIPRQQELPEKRLQELAAALRSIRPCQKRQHRVRLHASVRIGTNQWHRRRRLRDQLHGAEPDRVAGEPQSRQRCDVPGSPDGTPAGSHRNQTSRGRGLDLRCRGTLPSKSEHRPSFRHRPKRKDPKGPRFRIAFTIV